MDLASLVVETVPMRPVIELLGRLVAPAREVEETSSALNASPLFQVTPLRTCRTYSVASSFTSQLDQVGLEGVVAGVLGSGGSSVWRSAWRDFGPAGLARILGVLDGHGDLEDVPPFVICASSVEQPDRSCRRLLRSRRRRRWPAPPGIRAGPSTRLGVFRATG